LDLYDKIAVTEVIEKTVAINTETPSFDYNAAV